MERKTLPFTALLLGYARRPRAVGWRKWREAAYPPISVSKLAGSLLGCVASGQPGNVMGRQPAAPELLFGQPARIACMTRR